MNTKQTIIELYKVVEEIKSYKKIIDELENKKKELIEALKKNKKFSKATIKNYIITKEEKTKIIKKLSCAEVITVLPKSKTQLLQAVYPNYTTLKNVLGISGLKILEKNGLKLGQVTSIVIREKKEKKNA